MNPDLKVEEEEEGLSGDSAMARKVLCAGPSRRQEIVAAAMDLTFGLGSRRSMVARL